MREAGKRSTVTIPAECRDDVVPITDSRARPLFDAGVAQVMRSVLWRGFDWPGPKPLTHLVLVTVAGEGVAHLGSEVHSLRAGTIVVAPAGLARRHSVRMRWEVVTIRLLDDDRWKGFHESGPIILESQDLRRFVAPVDGMLAELPSGNSMVQGLAEGRSPLETLLDRFDGRVGSPVNLDPQTGVPGDPFSLHAAALRLQLETLLAVPSADTAEQQKLASLWEAVRRRPASDWSVRAAARHVGVSPATLHRLVRRHHQMPTAMAIKQIRMDHAARLLIGGGLPVAAVAAQVGYASPFSFSTAFRQHHGRSPTDFRHDLS